MKSKTTKAIYLDLLRRFSIKLDKAYTDDSIDFWGTVYFSTWSQYTDSTTTNKTKNVTKCITQRER